MMSQQKRDHSDVVFSLILYLRLTPGCPVCSITESRHHGAPPSASGCLFNQYS